MPQKPELLTHPAETFRLFADSGQCKHIFFAGCHDTGYLSLLMPYRGKADRITLIKAASFSPEYYSLELPVEELPAVFRSTSLDGNPLGPAARPNPTFNTNENARKPPQKAPPISDKYIPAALMPRQGNLKYSNQVSDPYVLQDGRRLKASDDNIAQPVQLPAPSHSPTNQFKLPLRREPIAALLPVSTTKTEGLIPVNKDGDRIDVFLPPPKPEAWELYQQRARIHKVCNELHLTGKCLKTNCAFDHSPLEPEAIYVMRYILRGFPCPRKGRCRQAICYNGHICQRDGCSGGKPCKLNHSMHSLDPRVFEWQPPIYQPEPVNGAAISEDSSEEPFMSRTPSLHGGAFI
jgi:hypothetical protein